MLGRRCILVVFLIFWPIFAFAPNEEVQLQIHEGNLNQLAALLEHHVAPSASPPNLNVSLMVPSTFSTQDIAILISQATAQIRARFPSAEPRFNIRTLAPSANSAEAASAAIQSQIQIVASRYPGNPEVAQIVDLLTEANQAALRQAQAARDRVSPGTVRLVQGTAAVQALIVTAARAWQIHSGGDTRGQLMAGLVMRAVDPNVTYFSSRYQSELNRFLSNRRLPLTQLLRYLEFDPRNPELVRSTVNLSIFSLLSFGLARPLAMQMLGHLNDPRQRGVGLRDVWEVGTNNALGALFGALGFRGLEDLRNMNRLTASQQEVILRMASLFDTVSMLMNSTPRLREYRWVTQWPVWGTYLTAAIASQIANPRPPGATPFTDSVDAVLADVGEDVGPIQRREFCSRAMRLFGRLGRLLVGH